MSKESRALKRETGKLVLEYVEKFGKSVEVSQETYRGTTLCVCDPSCSNSLYIYIKKQNNPIWKIIFPVYSLYSINANMDLANMDLPVTFGVKRKVFNKLKSCLQDKRKELKALDAKIEMEKIQAVMDGLRSACATK